MMGCEIVRYEQTYESSSRFNRFFFKREISEKKWVSDAHFHNSIEFIFHIKNTVKVHVNGDVTNMKGNDILVINPLEVHYFELEKGSEYIALRVDKNMLNVFYSMCKTKKKLEPVFERILLDSIKNDAITEKVLIWEKDLYKQNGGQIKDGMYDITLKNIGYFNVLMGELVDAYPPIMCKAAVNSNNFEIRLTSYLTHNFKNKISLDILAKEFGYNKNVISRKIYKILNQDLRNYVNNLRLNNVKKMLEEENMTIEFAALSSGFTNMSTYYRAANAKARNKENRDDKANDETNL